MAGTRLFMLALNLFENAGVGLDGRVRPCAQQACMLCAGRGSVFGSGFTAVRKYAYMHCRNAAAPSR